MHTHIRSAIRRSSLPYKFPCSSPSLVMAPNGPRSLSNFTIGTFNVRGLSSATKRDQLSEDLNKRHIDVCCIQETKCPGGFDVVSDYYRLIGLPSTSRHYGLAFAVASYLEDKLLRYWSVSDRLAVIQLSLGRHSTLTVINAYGPTSQVTLHDQDTQYDFYSALDSITTRYSSSALTLIAGDFNSKLGRKLTNERSIGEHSCGTRNTNGTVLAGFLETHGLFACNTAFQHATRHKTTWQGQYRDATNGNIVPIYNTIDFVICRVSHKSLLTDSRAYAGTLLDSDHRLLIAQLDLSRLYYVWSENAQPPSAKHTRYNTEQLASGPLRAQFRDAVSESLPEVNPDLSASQKWDLLKGTLKSAAETSIGRSIPRHKNPHCQDMAAISETQRNLRLQINNTRNPARKQELKQQRNRILHAQRRSARDNASVRLDHLASEVERLHDGAKMFRAVQEMTRKPASELRIQDDSGRVICNAAELNERVTHHFGQQFNDPRVMELPAFTGVPSPLTMPITPGEVQRAISKLNSGRACGHDDLPADLLKSTADLIAPAIAGIFNEALEHHESWRTTRKLGSLLGDAEDVTRRMQLANVSFHKMWTVSFRGAQISLLLRLRLYSAFVLPVLTYNMGTWGLTKTELSRLDAHHRRHLRQIIGIRWPHRISNDALYRRTNSSPISAAIRAARWSLFGHVLRLPLDAPVQRAIDAYLEDTGTPKFRGRPRCTLPTTLGENLRRIGRQLHNSDDINALRTLDRRAWRDLGRELA